MPTDNKNQAKKSGSKKTVYRFRPKYNKDDNALNEFPKYTPEESENDIDLMMIFGMDEEAKQKDPEKYQSVKRGMREKRAIKGKQEYISPAQKEEFEKLSKERKTGATVKMYLTIAVLVMSLIFEFIIIGISEYGNKLSNLYSPVIPSLIALQIVLFCGALGYRQLFDGMKIFTGRPNSHTVFSLFTVLYSLYYIYLSVSAVSGTYIITLHGIYTTPLCLSLLIEIISERYNLSRNEMTFDIVSKDTQKKYKYTFEINGRNKKGTSRLAPDGGKALSVRKTEFISGFVSRSNSDVKNRGLYWAIVLMSLITAIGILAYKLISGAPFLTAIIASMLSLSFTMPVCISLPIAIYFTKSVKASYNSDAAIIGDRSFREYSAASAVYFDDKAVFPQSGIKLNNFKMYGTLRMDECLEILAAVYTRIGAPPAELFKQSSGAEISDHEIRIVDISSFGLHAIVDSRPVYIGEASYMEECGFKVPDVAEDTEPLLSVLYVSVDMVLSMKIGLLYSFDKKIIKTVASLKRKGMYLGICTCDPGINEKMLGGRISLTEYPMGILKGGEEKLISKPLKSVSSGIVSNSGTESLLSALINCMSGYRAYKTDFIIRFFTVSAGIIMSVLITLFGGAEGVAGSAYMLIFQLMAMIPTLIIYMFMRTEK